MTLLPVVDILNDATGAVHRRLAALPFLAALADDRLPRQSYAGLLRALALSHESLEGALSQAAEPRVAAVWTGALRWLPSLQSDLHALDADHIEDTPAATVRAVLLAQSIRQAAQATPIALLGYTYAVYTLLGDQALARVMQGQADRQPAGSAYVRHAQRWLAVERRQFEQRLNDTPLTPDDLTVIVMAASHWLRGLRDVIAALYPLRPLAPEQLVALLNPRAGSHAIPVEAAELDAALRAGERTYARFPYYTVRYGEKGLQFTRSDSAWLVTLTRLTATTVTHQVVWLADLLAQRGMPRWLLEVHLGYLFEELTQRRPAHRLEYEKLRDAAAVLAQTRRAVIGDGVLLALEDEFAARLDAKWRTPLQGVGGMLAAAVADEQAGVKYAVSSLAEWLLEEGRFPRSVREATRETLARAHAEAQRAVLAARSSGVSSNVAAGRTRSRL